MIVVGLAISLVSTAAASTPCPSSTVTIDVTAASDVRNLADALACTGAGTFNITWYLSTAIEQTIEVSHTKDVTVTGVGMPSIRAASADNNADEVFAGGGSDTGIFAASKGSTLRLNQLVLEGGDAEHGGAVNLRSNSSLFASGCIFTHNTATYGGETH